MSAPYAVILRQPSRDDLRNAILRVWAADVRDRRPPYQEASPAAALLAGVLCRVLNTSDWLIKSGRPHCGLGETRETGNRQLAGNGHGAVTESMLSPKEPCVLRWCFGDESQATGRNVRSSIVRAPTCGATTLSLQRPPDEKMSQPQS